MEKFNESMFGRKVRFTNATAHEEEPWFYPEVGTIGTIVPTDGTNFEDFDNIPYVIQWPSESTSQNDLWATEDDSIELIDEEIGDMVAAGDVLNKNLKKVLDKSAKM